MCDGRASVTKWWPLTASPAFQWAYQTRKFKKSRAPSICQYLITERKELSPDPP